jgi:YbbR domain-containing protein
LTFDVSTQLKQDSGHVQIPADLLRNGINTLLQGTTKLQNITPEQLGGTYFRQHSKKVPIRLNASVSPATQYQIIGEPILQPQRVNVFGRKAQLDTLSRISTQLLMAENIKDTVVLTATLNVPEGLRVVDNTIQVSYVSEQFTEKVLTKPIIARHVPEDTHLRLFPSEVTVSLRVGVAHFNEIDDNDVHVYCDYPRNGEEKLTLEVKCHNPYVTYSRCNPASVEFLIEK